VHARHAQIARRVTLSHACTLALSGKSERSFRMSRLGKRGVSRPSRDARWDAMACRYCSTLCRARTNNTDRTVKSCGSGIPVLMPCRRASVAHRQGQESRSLGRARISRNPFAQGRPVIWLKPVVLPRAFLLHADRGYQLIPGLPCALRSREGDPIRITRAVMSRGRQRATM